jgi:hypothetical protein
MRLYSSYGLLGDSEKQFIYNLATTPEDDLALDQGNFKEE